MSKISVRRERKELIAFYVSAEEKNEIIELARDRDQTISDYCRQTLLRNSKETVKDV